jgi:O-methyltransferase involved in polyketide biosynthesis
VKLQVVNLGAGFDTMYWILKDKITRDKAQQRVDLKYVEVDLADVVYRKVQLVEKDRMLQ